MYSTSSNFLTKIKEPSRSLKCRIDIGGSTNKCPSNVSYWEQGSYDLTNGSKVTFPSRIRLINLLPVQPNTTYYVNTFETNATYTIQLGFRAMGSDGSFVRSIGGVADGGTFTTGATEHYLGVFLYASGDTITGAELLSNVTDGTVKPFICLYSETDKTFKDYSTISLTEENVVEFSIESSLSTSGLPAIGGVVSDLLNITFINSGLPTSFEGLTIRPHIGVLLDNGFYEYIPMGVFYPDIESISKTNQTLEIQCFDVLAKMGDIEYMSDLTYPTLVSSVFNEITTKYGIKFANTGSLPAVYLDSIPLGTTRETLCDIAELVSANAVVNRFGEIEFKFLTSTGFSIDGNNYIDFKLLSDTDVTISKLICAKTGENELNLEYGDDTGTAFSFTNDSINFVSELQTIYDRVYPLTYTPFECNLQGMPHLDVGDDITITDIYNIVRVLPILNSSIKFSGGLLGSIRADVPSREVVETGSNGENVLSRTITQLVQNSATRSELTQTADSINIKFERLGGTNLVKNSTWNNGDMYWSLFSGAKTIVLPESDKPTSYRARFYSSGATSDTLLQTPCDAFPIKADGLTSYTVSFDIKTTSVAGIDGNALFTIRAFNNTVDTSQGTSVWYRNISKTELVNAGLTDGQWLRYTLVITPTAGTYLRISPYLTRNGEVFFRETQVETGMVALAWSPNADEIYTGFTKIDGSGITVTNGGIRIKNNNGDTVLSGDVDGNLWVQNTVTVGGTSNGKIQVKDSLGAVSTSIDSTGITVLNDNLKIASNMDKTGALNTLKPTGMVMSGLMGGQSYEQSFTAIGGNDIIVTNLFNGGWQYGIDFQTAYMKTRGNLTIKYGDLIVETPSYTTTALRVEEGTTAGTILLMGAGGATVVGSGESASNYYDNVGITASSESMFVTSDFDIQFITNCNTIANRKTSVLNSAGVLNLAGGIQVGGKDVVDYGGNTNGLYVRFYDGTQICWSNMYLTNYPITNAYGSVFYANNTFTYPIAFISTPTVTSSLQSTGVTFTAVNSISTSAVAIRAVNPTSTTIASGILGYIAIGKWM